MLDVEFSMPLLKKNKGINEDESENNDTGDCENEFEEEEEENSSEILETLGLEASQFPTLSQSRHKL